MRLIDGDRLAGFMDGHVSGFVADFEPQKERRRRAVVDRPGVTAAVFQAGGDRRPRAAAGRMNESEIGRAASSCRRPARR